MFEDELHELKQCKTFLLTSQTTPRKRPIKVATATEEIGGHKMSRGHIKTDAAQMLREER